jgi:hypothetical protein
MEKSVNSKNLWQSRPCRQTYVILTFYAIVKANGGELKVVTVENEGSVFKGIFSAYKSNS